MIAQILAALILTAGITWCLYQTIGSLGQQDRRAAFVWSSNGLIQVAWGGLLAWGGFW